MPNTFAYLVLFSWPLVAVVLFAAQPPARALSLAVIVGYLLLPVRTGIDLPMIPAIDKVLVINLTAAAVTFLALKRERQVAGSAAVPAPSSRIRWVFYGLIALTLVTPFITVLTNGEPVIAGPRYIPGIRLYDAVSLMVSAGITIVPFMLGMRVLGTPAAQKEVLRILVLAGCAYAFLVLFEARMSPQLHNWIYGFFPHSFAQHIRGGAFRPMVFLGHGLAVGIFLCITVLAACALYRQSLRDNPKEAPLWLFAALWLALTLLLSRNLGATMLMLLFAPIILLAPSRLQLVTAAALAGIVLIYPMLRTANLAPVEALSTMARTIDERRALSLEFRFHHEDALLARANKKPIVGWGSWGRNRVYDPDTGRDLSVTDGLWIITLGSFGWLGYLAQFGLLTIPVFFRVTRTMRTSVQPSESGISILIAVSAINLIPNASLASFVWLLSGGLSNHLILTATKPNADTHDIQTRQNIPIYSQGYPHVRRYRT